MTTHQNLADAAKASCVALELKATPLLGGIVLCFGLIFILFGAVEFVPKAPNPIVTAEAKQIGILSLLGGSGLVVVGGILFANRKVRIRLSRDGIYVARHRVTIPWDAIRRAEVVDLHKRKAVGEHATEVAVNFAPSSGVMLVLSFNQRGQTLFEDRVFVGKLLRKSLHLRNDENMVVRLFGIDWRSRSAPFRRPSDLANAIQSTVNALETHAKEHGQREDQSQLANTVVSNTKRDRESESQPPRTIPSAEPTGVFRDKRYLVVNLKKYRFPPTCLKSGLKTANTFENADYYFPMKRAWLYIILGGALGYAIAKRHIGVPVKITIPLDRKWIRTHEPISLIAAIFLVVGLTMIVAGLFVAVSHWIGTVILMIGFILTIGMLILIFVRSQKVTNPLTVAKLEDETVWFTGVDPDVLKGFPELEILE